MARDSTDPSMPSGDRSLHVPPYPRTLAEGEALRESLEGAIELLTIELANLDVRDASGRRLTTEAYNAWKQARLYTRYQHRRALGRLQQWLATQAPAGISQEAYDTLAYQLADLYAVVQEVLAAQPRQLTPTQQQVLDTTKDYLERLALL